MNIQYLGTGKYAAFDNVRARIGAAYEQIASGSDYRKNTVHRNHDHDDGTRQFFWLTVSPPVSRSAVSSPCDCHWHSRGE